MVAGSGRAEWHRSSRQGSWTLARTRKGGGDRHEEENHAHRIADHAPKAVDGKILRVEARLQHFRGWSLSASPHTRGRAPVLAFSS